MEMEEIERSLYSWLGHAEYGDTYNLRSKMLEGFVLSRGIEQKFKGVKRGRETGGIRSAASYLADFHFFFCCCRFLFFPE